MGIKIVVKNSSEAFAYKDQVTDQGLHLEHDYTWRYTPAVNDYFGAEQLTPATVQFEFRDAKWITYFQLRWAQ